MLSATLYEALTDQMNYEFYSSHVYLAMASYCENENYDGFAKFFHDQAEEERAHGMKIYKYIQNRGEQASISGFENPNNKFESVLDAFEKGLEHEKEVTSRIYNLSEIAGDEKEYATISFLKWFLDEQVEEESSFNNIIQKLKRMNNDPNSLLIYDLKIGEAK
ncbi:ferritin [Bacillus sp. V3B]|uniref:ferritin n=1 Tax=Bacillus sp. V3B TaxID=2804915 RepID=UPI0021086F32|nr:ferritin [Bacillus sp. V3B]MCQ6277449.1 ferritin [Bacillus sp. V3B]